MVWRLLLPAVLVLGVSAAVGQASPAQPQPEDRLAEIRRGRRLQEALFG